MMALEQALEQVERDFDNAGFDGNGIDVNTPFDINVKNVTSGQKVVLGVMKANTLGQVLMATADKIGVDTSKNDIIFVNENTKVDATDLSLTLGAFKVEPDTTIGIIGNGKVAAC